MFNVAGAGKLPWSEVATIGGAHLLSAPAVRAPFLLGPAAPAGARPVPAGDGRVIRYGRGVDTSRLIETGFRYRYTSAGAVESFARANNLRRTVGSGGNEYRYEQDVEQFFRHSPAVIRGIDG